MTQNLYWDQPFAYASVGDSSTVASQDKTALCSYVFDRSFGAVAFGSATYSVVV